MRFCDWISDVSSSYLFINISLNPAEVVEVIFDPNNDRAATVLVPDYQLSLAIGKRGQNARLAARLTGFKIDIKPESAREEAIAEMENQSTETVIDETNDEEIELDDNSEE